MMPAVQGDDLALSAGSVVYSFAVIPAESYQVAVEAAGQGLHDAHEGSPEGLFGLVQRINLGHPRHYLLEQASASESRPDKVTGTVLGVLASAAGVYCLARTGGDHRG
jgi:hypothetical protein